MAILAVTGLVNLAAPGIPHWYTYARSALALVAAPLFFAVARADRSVPWFVRLAIAVAVLRLLLDVSVYATRSTSWTVTAIYGIALPAVVAVYAIVAVTLVAKEQAAQRTPVVR
jgi:hypothetical protein